MVSTQMNSAIQTDILPTQNIGLLDQNQPQIYSLLGSSNSPSSTKKHRRKKTTKLEETIPVTTNPQITRALSGVSFPVPHHCLTMLPDSIPSSISTHHINGHTLPIRCYMGHDSYDANNNINHNQISSLSMPLNCLLPSQTQQNLSLCNDSLQAININSIPQMVEKSQIFEINRLLNNNINERPVSVPSTDQNEYKHLNSSFMFPEKGSLVGYSYSLPSPLSSISTSAVPPPKPKRKYTKKLHVPAPVEQQTAQQISQSSTTITQTTTLSALPTIIPASVTVTSIKSGEHSFPMDISTTSNFMPLTPPASISSIKSPPTTINNEYPVMQQNSVPQTTTHIAEVNRTPKPYFYDQGFSHTQKTMNDSSASYLPYNLHNLLAAVRQQYCMIPTNMIPTNVLPMESSISSGTITNIPSVSISTDIKKERKKREKSTRKSKVVQNSIVQTQTDEQFLTSKTLTTDIRVTRKQRQKNSHIRDIRTKKQLRRITRRNQLAVLKFLMRKRKQQKEERMLTSQLPEVKVEQMVPKSISTYNAKPDTMETNLPDIIAPNLKISFDATQNIESIALYYHQRRKPGIINESTPKSLTNTDNKLGLLIEAVEFIETLNGSSKLTLPSVK